MLASSWSIRRVDASWRNGGRLFRLGDALGQKNPNCPRRLLVFLFMTDYRDDTDVESHVACLPREGSTYSPIGAGTPLLSERTGSPERRCGWNPLAWTRASQVKALVFLVIVAAVIIGVLVFRVQHQFEDLLQWLHDHPTEGAFVFVGVYIAATVFFIPGSLLTIGAGYIFSPIPLAVAIVVIGAGIGLVLAFLLGRYVFREWVERQISAQPKFDAIDRAVRQEGWKIVLLVRLAPIIPFNFLNYALSLTSVEVYRAGVSAGNRLNSMQFLHYTWSSILGIVPGTTMYVYFGSLAKDIKQVSSGHAGPSKTDTIIIAAVSGVVIIAAVVFITVLARRAIARALDEQQRSAAREGVESVSHASPSA